VVDERLVRQAIELARRARQEGNHPFGALLALNGIVLLTVLAVISLLLLMRFACRRGFTL
jgi:hypothetical protein